VVLARGEAPIISVCALWRRDEGEGGMHEQCYS